MKREVTTQEALTELAAQQLLVLKEQLLSSKDDQINFQIFTIKEKDKVINQKENEIQQLKEELQETIQENKLSVKAYKRRKCGRKKLADNLERVPIYHDIPEEEKICGCGAKLVKVGERFTEKLNIIPERIYVEKHIYPVYACRNCEGSGDEVHPVFRQAPAAKNIIQQGIATPGLWKK